MGRSLLRCPGIARARISKASRDEEEAHQHGRFRAGTSASCREGGRGEDFQYVLTRYALERLMVRLVRSAHRDVFLLKGAMLFRAWSPTMHRPTKDLDLLGNGAPDLDRLAGIFRDVCGVQVEDDGVTFGPKGVAAERIKEDADYEGVRVTMRARIGMAKLDLQIDVGFGDAVTPEATEIDFPTGAALLERIG
jgi:hypothetical protein